MNYREAVENEIEGDEDEKSRRKRLWQEIADSFEHGGEYSGMSTLNEKGEGLTKRFEKLLKELDKRL